MRVDKSVSAAAPDSPAARPAASTPARGGTRYVGGCLFLWVAIEALGLLSRRDFRSSNIFGGDGLEYNRLALNILHHASFSMSAAAPYDPSIFRSPGYPAFVAFIYAIAGYSPLAVRVAQFILLAIMAWLLYLLGQRFVSPAAAVTGAVLCTLYWPFLYLATYHLTETLADTLAVLFMLLLLSSLEQPENPRYAFLVGLTAGVIALVRMNLALLSIAAMVAYVWPTSYQRLLSQTAKVQQPPAQRQLQNLGLALTGLLLCLAPWTVRNALVMHRLVPVSVGGSGSSLDLSMRQYAGEISYNMNPADWKTFLTEEKWRWQRAEREAAHGSAVGVPARAQTELLCERDYGAAARAKFHELRATQILSSIPTRLMALWAAGDDPPRLHRFIMAEYYLLIALMALGAWFSRHRLLQQWPLWIMSCYLSIVHLVYHVEARYTYPARSFLLLYAGVAIVHLFGKTLSGAHGGKDES